MWGYALGWLVHTFPIHPRSLNRRTSGVSILGVWRSLEARFLGMEEAPSSNLGTSTITAFLQFDLDPERIMTLPTKTYWRAAFLAALRRRSFFFLHFHRWFPAFFQARDPRFMGLGDLLSVYDAFGRVHVFKRSSTLETLAGTSVPLALGATPVWTTIVCEGDSG